MSPIPGWVEGARLAPSAHNTQPWRFRRQGDGSLQVTWDPDRALPASDPTQRDLGLGMGAAVEAARLQAAVSGQVLLWKAAPALMVASEPGPSGPSPAVVGVLRPGPGMPAHDDSFLGAQLSKRQTGRVAHLPRPVPPDLAEAMAAEAAQWGCTLRLLADWRRTGSGLLAGQRLNRLAGMAGQATMAQFADPVVHRELHQWLRLHPSHPDYERDGLTAACLGLRGPTLVAARLLLAPGVMRWLSRVRLHRLLAADTVSLVQQSASMCLLTGSRIDLPGLVAAGRCLLRMWLRASAAGLAAHPVSALLDCADTADPTAAIFGAGQGESPLAVFRLGYCPALPRAPRLPATELFTHEDGDKGGSFAGAHQ